MSISPHSNSSHSNQRSHRFFLRRWGKRIGIILIGVMLFPLLLSIIYGFIPPPISSLMVWRYVGGAPIEQSWVDIEHISPYLVRSVVISEDARICTHNGVDWHEVSNVFSDIRADKRARGASTIAMQVSKNLFLWPHRSILRKILEVPLAFWISMLWKKHRLVEIYLNIAEWDRGIFGAQAASRHYFNKPASALNTYEASLLAALLPSPHTRSASHPDAKTRALASDIRKKMRESASHLWCLHAQSRQG